MRAPPEETQAPTDRILTPIAVISTLVCGLLCASRGSAFLQQGRGMAEAMDQGRET